VRKEDGDGEMEGKERVETMADFREGARGPCPTRC